MDCLEGIEQGFSKDILGVIRVSTHPHHLAVNRILVAPY
jgi:hypothetical protein